MSKVPVTVLTGISRPARHVLTASCRAHGQKYAVIVNEFGEIGIDKRPRGRRRRGSVRDDTLHLLHVRGDSCASSTA